MKLETVQQLTEPRLTPEARYKRLVNHLIYKIATGKWITGTKLPSVRDAEKIWGVERREVLKGYKHLESLGLVHGQGRSGYFVAAGQRIDRVQKHRTELERVFTSVTEEIRSRTGLSPLGVFRYFANLAEIKSREEPECVYVECTLTQATGHAREIERRLDVPCAALTVDHIADRPERIPPSIKHLITNPFHASRLRPLAVQSALSFHSFPIELSPEIVADGKRLRNVVVLELTEREAENIANDIRALIPNANVSYRASKTPDALIREILEESFNVAQFAVFASPRVWGALDPQWREHPSVREATFRIVEMAWLQIADAIGLPLGVLNNQRDG